MNKILAMAGLILGLTSHASPLSTYSQLRGDVNVHQPTTILKSQIHLPSTDTVLVQSDGAYAPLPGPKNRGLPSAATVHIRVDGHSITNDAVIDWRRTNNRVQHSYNVIGALRLTAGPHTFELVAAPLNGASPFVMVASSNLSVMVHPADEVVERVQPMDSRRFDDFQTCGIKRGLEDFRPTPHEPLPNLTYEAPFGNEQVVALASGRVYWSHELGWWGDLAQGDALLNLYLDGAHAGNHQSTWSINDLYHGAELQAPVFNHGLFDMTAGWHRLSFDASEFPYDDLPNDLKHCRENHASYQVGAGTRLVVLRGGMNVTGGHRPSNRIDQTTDFVFVGGSDRSISPPLNTDFILAEETFTIPENHDGVVMFNAKTRPQGDLRDRGGWATIRIFIDGVHRGSMGSQRIAYPNSESSRTLTASYLAAGRSALKPGQHTVKVIGRADGSFLHLAMSQELPLLWFD